MDKLVTALGPVFVAGLAIQQLMEILDPILDKVSGEFKRCVAGVISLVAGLGLAFAVELHVLNLIGALKEGQHILVDTLITGVIISGGTEGVNSILKFLKYSKENKKNDAAAKSPENANVNALAAGTTTVLVPTREALEAMNRK